MTGPCLPVALAAAIFVVVGCGVGDPPARSSGQTRSTETKPRARRSARPALCGRLRARVTGRVRTPAATELSGLAISRTQPRVLWAHNDSGDGPRVLAFSPSGAPVAEIAVAGAEHVDWEDMAVGPLAGPGDGLFIGDIGDNRAARATVTVFRVREPRLAHGVPGVRGLADRLTLRYPDGAHDAEALLVDPSSGALVIVTKDFSGVGRIYVARSPRTAGTTALRAAGRVSLGPAEAVTAGDVSANGRTILLRTYDRAFVWPRRRGQSLAAALRRRPCISGTSLLGEGQGEAAALTAGGRAFYTVPEGRAPALRRYAPAR